MEQYVSKDIVVAEIERIKSILGNPFCLNETAKASWIARKDICEDILSFLNTLEVKDPYEECIQYDSIKAGIQAHAETYSFNIESELFHQLTKEQQKLWRKEIEQACISGGYNGLDLAKDPRYKENLEMKEVEEYKQPEYSCFETTYECGKKPRWNVGDTLAYYEFCSDREGECVFGKITKVDFDEEQCDWFYTFEDGSVCDEQSLLEGQTYKKN